MGFFGQESKTNLVFEKDPNDKTRKHTIDALPLIFTCGIEIIQISRLICKQAIALVISNKINLTQGKTAKNSLIFTRSFFFQWSLTKKHENQKCSCLTKNTK